MQRELTQRLRRTFSGLPGGASGLAPEHDSGYALPDPDYLILNLNIIEQATRHGQNGVPSPDATGLDATEGTVKAHMEAAASRSWAIYKERFNGLERELGSMPFRSQWTSPMELAEGFKRQSETALQNAEHAIRRLFVEMCDAHSTWEGFREKNGLVRKAMLNDADPSRKLAIFAISFLIEWLFNGYYLGQRLEGGFFAGLSIAASIAAVNIGLGFLIGRFCLPHLLHIRQMNKALGGAGLTVLALCVLALNLGVGHMRTVLGGIELDSLDAMAKAFSRLIEMPFSIGDMTSVVLVFVGLLCATSSVWGAFRWDEYYPGYADVSRRLRDTLEELEQTRSFELLRTTRMRDSVEEEIKNLRSSIPSQIQEYLRITAEMQQLQRNFMAHIVGLEGVLNTVIRRYRDINVGARKGVLAPAYFKTPVQLTVRILDDLSRFGEDLPLLKHIEDEVKQQMGDALALVNTEHENGQSRISALLPGHIEPSIACKGAAEGRRDIRGRHGGEEEQRDIRGKHGGEEDHRQDARGKHGGEAEDA